MQEGLAASEIYLFSLQSLPGLSKVPQVYISVATPLLLKNYSHTCLRFCILTNIIFLSPIVVSSYIMASNSNTSMSDLLAYARVPAYTCPPGTKMWILNLGTLTVDEGWFVITNSYPLSGLLTPRTGCCEGPIRVASVTKTQRASNAN
jgi:hypothetical protein